MGNRKEFFGGINEDEKKTEFVLEFSHLKFPSLLHIFVLNRLYYLRGKISSSSLCHPFSHRTYVCILLGLGVFLLVVCGKSGQRLMHSPNHPQKC